MLLTNCLPSCDYDFNHKETPCIKGSPILLCLRFRLRNVHLLIETLTNQFRNLHSIKGIQIWFSMHQKQLNWTLNTKLWEVDQTSVVTLNCIVHWSFLKSVARSKHFKFNTKNIIAHNWWCLRQIIIYSSVIENIKERSINSVKEIQTNNERTLPNF